MIDASRRVWAACTFFCFTLVFGTRHTFLACSCLYTCWWFGHNCAFSTQLVFYTVCAVRPLANLDAVSRCNGTGIVCILHLDATRAQLHLIALCIQCKWGSVHLECICIKCKRDSGHLDAQCRIVCGVWPPPLVHQQHLLVVQHRGNLTKNGVSSRTPELNVIG